MAKSAKELMAKLRARHQQPIPQPPEGKPGMSFTVARESALDAAEYRTMHELAKAKGEHPPDEKVIARLQKKLHKLIAKDKAMHNRAHTRHKRHCDKECMYKKRLASTLSKKSIAQLRKQLLTSTAHKNNIFHEKLAEMLKKKEHDQRVRGQKSGHLINNLEEEKRLFDERLEQRRNIQLPIGNTEAVTEIGTIDLLNP
jgi:hypothetical protein